MKKNEDEAFISFKEMKITYCKFNNIIKKIINQLTEEGVSRGDAVAVYMTNCVEMVGAIAALVIMNCKLVLIYAYEHQKTAEVILEECGCKKILCNNITYNGIEKFSQEALLINITTFTEDVACSIDFTSTKAESLFGLAIVKDSALGEIWEDSFETLIAIANHFVSEFAINGSSILCLNQKVDNLGALSQIMAAFISGAKILICSEADISNPLKIVKIANEKKASVLLMVKKDWETFLRFRENGFLTAEDIENIMVFDNMAEEFTIEGIAKKEKDDFLNMSVTNENSDKLSLMEKLVFDVINAKLRILNLEMLKEDEIEKSLTEVGFDSLDYMQLVVWLEESFDIEFEDDKLEYREFGNCYEMISYVAQMAETTRERNE